MTNSFYFSPSRSPTGTLTAIQVDSQYRRRGLGTLVTETMTQKLSDLDMDTFALVTLDNIASRCMFEKIGFKIVDFSYFLGTNPLAVNDSNDLKST